MRKMENKALMAAFDYLTENGMRVASLVFDCLLVDKGSQTKELLEGCANAVRNKLPGFKIAFTAKEMNEGYGIQVEQQNNHAQCIPVTPKRRI